MMEREPGATWIVEFWSRIFYLLGHLSLFESVRRIFPKLQSHSATEFYVFFNSLASLVALAVAAYRLDESVSWLLVAAALYGAYRSFEITVFQIDLLMFHQYRARQKNIAHSVRSYRRTVILLIHNYFEIVCWFGTIYVWLYRSGHIASLGSDPSFFSVFRESMLMMFSFTPEKYQPANDPAVVAFSIQAVIGLIMSLIVFARFLALLPAPKTDDDFENADMAAPPRSPRAKKGGGK